MLTTWAMWKRARSSVAVRPASRAMRRRFASRALTNSVAAAGNPMRTCAGPGAGVMSLGLYGSGAMTAQWFARILLSDSLT